MLAGAFNARDAGAGIYRSADAGLTWSAVQTFTDRGVWIDMSVDPTDPRKAMVGGWLREGVSDPGVVYKTDDGGLSWTPALTVPVPNGAFFNVTSVLIHPITPTIWYAAGRGPGAPHSTLFISQDSGATWPISATIPGGHVLSLAADGTLPNTLYAGTGNSSFTWGRSQVWRSVDAGRTWTVTHPDGGAYVAFSPPATVYAVADWGQLFVNHQHGEPGAWNTASGWESPTSIAVDLHASPRALYVGTREMGVAKSVDHGGAWEFPNEGIFSPARVWDIDVDPQDLQTIFVGARCGGAWASRDQGASWQLIEGSCTTAVAVNPHNPAIIYLGQDHDRAGAIMRSSDHGMNFTRVYTAPFILPDGSGGGQNIRGLVISQASTKTVFAVGRSYPTSQPHHGVILRSRDDGVSWSLVITDAHLDLNMVAIAPQNPAVVYAGGQKCDQHGCFGVALRSLNGGDSWTETLVASDTVSSIVVEGNGAVVYAGDRSYTVRKSNNFGDTWSVVRQYTAHTPSGYLLANDPRQTGRVLLGGWGYVAESRNGGQTWTDWGNMLNVGTPPWEPTALTLDAGLQTQTLYAGFAGVWSYRLAGPEPFGAFLPQATR